MVKQYKCIGDPPFVDNVYLMASAFNPIFAYHWINIDVDAELNEAQISHAEQNTKCNIEELIIKEEALVRRTTLSRVIAKTAASIYIFVRAAKKS